MVSGSQSPPLAALRRYDPHLRLDPDEFARVIFAIMAVDMIDELAKSEDKTTKANADFVAANKNRGDTIFGAFLMLGRPGPAPASTTP